MRYFLIFLILVSCRPTDEVILYKDKGLLMTSISTNSIKDFKWAYKSEKIFDSLVFKGEKGKKINSIINGLEQISNNELPMGTPRYAFILDYNKKKDTLYFYDFNDENYMDTAYLVQNRIALKDRNNILKNYLFANYWEFISKEYYYVPGDSEEHYYIKERNSSE